MKSYFLLPLLILFAVNKPQLSETGNALKSISEPNQDKPADILFEKYEYDFGSIKSDTMLTYEFKFVNNGGEPLNISNVSTSCGCLVAEWPHETINHGVKKVIKVYFNVPKGPTNTKKTVTITSNAKSGFVILTIKAKIVS